MDPFEALGVERRWDVTETVIREAQRRMAARWHPDRFRDPAERDAAQRRVTLANEAATRLLDPLERGRAVLDHFRPAAGAVEPRPSATFLAEMLGLHEGLASGDAEAVSRLAVMRTEAEAEVAGHFSRLVGGDAAAWADAAAAMAILRAIVRAMEGWKA